MSLPRSEHGSVLFFLVARHITFFLFGLTLSIILLFFFYIKYRTFSHKLENLVKEKTKALENERMQLSEVNQELKVEQSKILESLDYAANIQRSILPVESDLLSFFSFVFHYISAKG